MLFNELSLNKELLDGIQDAKFDQCLPVQERTFAETLQGQDVYVQSQTGSGKTAAFLISVFEHMKRGTFETNRALIIVPTRELAVQIEEEAKVLGGHLPFKVGSFYGGVGYDNQLRMLEEKVEIIIGTPGRLIDLDQRRKLDFGDTSMLVIDEADRLFDMGFLPDLRKMLKRMPPRDKRLTMLFSATLNARVWHLAWEYMNDPVQIILNPENLTVSEVHQELYHVAQEDKFRLLLGILAREKAGNVLIFTNTKNGAVEVSQRLGYNGYNSKYIIGDLPQKKRLRLIDQMKAGELQILVATDVAARGLHINDLPLVVNYDLPEDPEGYVHRIGRTARAGNTGKAVALACERFVYSLESIETLIDAKIPVEWFDDSLLPEDKSIGQRIERLPRAGGSRPGGSGSGERRARGPRDRRPRSGGSRTGGPRAEESRRPPKSRPQPKSNRPQATRPHPPRKAPSRTSSAEQQHKKKVSSQSSIEDRLAHYKAKYGEDFKLPEKELKQRASKTGNAAVTPSPESSGSRKKTSVLRKLFGKLKKS